MREGFAAGISEGWRRSLSFYCRLDLGIPFCLNTGRVVKIMGADMEWRLERKLFKVSVAGMCCAHELRGGEEGLSGMCKISSIMKAASLSALPTPKLISGLST